MNLKLKRALTTMAVGIFVYLLFGMIIQTIANNFHVTWRIIPDLRLLTKYPIYWMLMIGFWFMAVVVYVHDLLVEKRYVGSYAYVIHKILTVGMASIAAYLWYDYIIQYQIRFLT
jgi:hypothetical protein